MKTIYNACGVTGDVSQFNLSEVLVTHVTRNRSHGQERYWSKELLHELVNNLTLSVLIYIYIISFQFK